MTITTQIFDSRSCTLGEGPLWHPERKQLFWFDIENFKLYSQQDGKPLTWDFGRHVSAAAWVDLNRLVIASETGLSLFDLTTGAEKMLCEIEADNPLTRSNDGRADPWGGFWLGTMSKAGVMGHGTLYRWLPETVSAIPGGELRILETQMSTPNGICFDYYRSCAYYTDTKTRIIWRQPVNPNTGWPRDKKDVFVDLSAREGQPEHKPDGAVVDAAGRLWSAQWGSARVACYSPQGDFLKAIELPTGHASCPAFGGADMKTLFVTTARQKLPAERADWHRTAGQTFKFDRLGSNYMGTAEPRLSLP